MPRLIAGVLIFLGSVTVAFAQTDSAKPQAKITISKETTYITGPLTRDGYVDYIAALNQQLSKGVTVENNVVVPLWQVFGPGEILKEWRKQYFQMLGLAELPEEGDYFEPLAEFAKRKKADQVDEAQKELSFRNSGPCTRLWSRQEFPLIAEWLDAQKKQVKLLVEMSRYTRMYAPVMSPGLTDERPVLLAAVRPATSIIWDAARILMARAMLAIQEGKTEEAHEYVLACHRLARLQGQGPRLLGTLLAASFEKMACDGDAMIVKHGNLTVDQARRYRKELRKLSPMPHMIDKILVAERYRYLDSIIAVKQRGYGLLESIMDGELLQGDAMKSLLESQPDWDEMLRLGNEVYDKVAEVKKATTRAERIIIAKAFDADMDRRGRSVRMSFATARGVAKLLTGSSEVGALPEGFSQLKGRLVGNALLTSSLLYPSVTFPCEAEDRATVRLQLSKLAYALAGYKAEQGRYPETLQQLVPAYVEQISGDLFSGKGFLYQAESDGFLLYSVGANGKDDGGQTYDSEPRGDDLVVDTRKQK